MRECSFVLVSVCVSLWLSVCVSVCLLLVSSRLVSSPSTPLTSPCHHQAHTNLVEQRDEFVTEAIVSFQKVSLRSTVTHSSLTHSLTYPTPHPPTRLTHHSLTQMSQLVYDLIVHETWRRKVYPLVLPHLDDDSSMKAYTMVGISYGALGLIFDSIAVSSRVILLCRVLPRFHPDTPTPPSLLGSTTNLTRLHH